jgi:hypothetical protein
MTHKSGKRDYDLPDFKETELSPGEMPYESGDHCYPLLDSLYNQIATDIDGVESIAESKSIVSIDGANLTIDGVETAIPVGISTVSTDGITILGDGVDTPLSAVAPADPDPSEGGTKLYNIARSLWEAPRAHQCYIRAAQEADGKAEFLCENHHMVAGDVLVFGAFANYNGTYTVAATSTADIIRVTAPPDWVSSQTGFATCALNKYLCNDQRGGQFGQIVSIMYISRPTVPSETVFGTAKRLVSLRGSLKETGSGALQTIEGTFIRFGGSGSYTYALTSGTNLIFTMQNCSMEPEVPFWFDYVAP